MRIAVVTLFPQLVEDALGYGVVGRAARRGLVEVTTVDPREFAADAHRTVDDRPYGGGPGMVMKVEPLRSAVRAARRALPQGAATWLLSAQGERFDQALACELAGEEALLLVAGRYEGVDERLIELEVDRELSIGDYVLSGGELAALIVIDAIVRLLPGALGHTQSAEQDSFSTGLLDYPQYTRPETVEGLRVPEVLLTGNHGDVARWRAKQALGRTWQRRPDLLARLELDEEQRALLEEYKAELTGAAE